jgi:hypothetical protein
VRPAILGEVRNIIFGGGKIHEEQNICFIYIYIRTLKNYDIVYFAKCLLSM